MKLCKLKPRDFRIRFYKTLDEVKIESSPSHMGRNYEVVNFLADEGPHYFAILEECVADEYLSYMKILTTKQCGWMFMHHANYETL